MDRASRITSLVKAHDYKLYCTRTIGKLCVYRKSQRVESYDVGEGKIMHFVRSTPHFIFALTHNWKMDGEPVDWGLEPIMRRLQEIDLWKRDIAAEVIEQEEKHLKSVERDRKNQTESFLSENRSHFKKAFSDINTANMRKKPKFKRMKE